MFTGFSSTERGLGEARSVTPGGGPGSWSTGFRATERGIAEAWVRK